MIIGTGSLRLDLSILCHIMIICDLHPLKAAFNFQTNNFGKGGSGNDQVNVSVQNSAAMDNADFATPPEYVNLLSTRYLKLNSSSPHYSGQAPLMSERKNVLVVRTQC